MKNKVSINDIAKQLNISKTTVSFILNGRAREKRISDSVVKKVQDLVEELDYKPNPLAQGLRTGKSNTIGLMVEDISNPFFANIARLIEDMAYQNGYKILYCSTDNKTEKTRELIKVFQERHVDGYIIAPPENIEEDVQALLKNGFPVVMFDRYLPEVNTDHVVVDNFQSTYQATQHLIQQGFKNIGFITFTSSQTQMQGRLLGYKEALKEADLKPQVKEVQFDRNENLIIDALTTYLKKNQGFDAILFGTNHIGACGLKVLSKLGLKIPQDVAVVSFDDYDVFQLSSPPITAVAQPFEEIANNIISLLLKKLANRTNTSIQKVSLSTNLIIRDSSIQAK